MLAQPFPMWIIILYCKSTILLPAVGLAIYYKAMLSNPSKQQIRFIEATSTTPGCFKILGPSGVVGYAGDEYNKTTVSGSTTKIEARTDKLFALGGVLYKYSSYPYKGSQLYLFATRSYVDDSVEIATMVADPGFAYLGIPVFADMTAMQSCVDHLSEYSANGTLFDHVYTLIDKREFPKSFFLKLGLRAKKSSSVQGGFTNQNYPIIMNPHTFCMTYDEDNQRYLSETIVVNHPKTNQPFDVTFCINVASDLYSSDFQCQITKRPDGVKIFQGEYYNWADFVEKNANFLIAPGDIIQYYALSQGWVLKAFVYPPVDGGESVGYVRLQDVQDLPYYSDNHWQIIWTYFP